MNDVAIPEKIGYMLQTMYPVAGKIQCKKGNDIYNDGIADACQCKPLQQKRIRKNNKIQADHILGNIGYAAAQAADHIHITYCIFSFAPAVPFFKKHQQ